MKIFLKIFLILFSLNNVYGQFGWYSQNSNTTNLVGGISMFDANRAIVVGFSGLISTTTNSGQNWNRQSISVSTNLHKVAFINNSIGCIIGELGVIYYTSTSGASWIPISSGTTSNLNDVRFTSIGNEITNTGYIAGSNGTILKTNNAGLNWTSLNSGTSQILTDISFADYNIGYAVGFNSTVLKTTNGGINWTSINTGYNYINNYGTRFINKDTGIVVGGSPTFTNGYIFKTTNGGVNWQVKLSNFLGSMNMVYYHNSNTLTVVGNYGVILKSYDGGDTWTIQSNQSDQFLHDVDFYNDNIGIAVGRNGTIVKTISGGLVNIEQTSSSIPKVYSLKQNYPNPFNPTTSIRFDIQKTGFVTLKVYSMQGAEVKSLVNENVNPGSYEVSLNAENLPSGIYFYTLQVNEFKETKKMMLIK